MHHLLVHQVAALHRAVVGDEDGTPVYGDDVPRPWPGGATSGPCWFDTPRDVSLSQDDGSRVQGQRSTVITTAGFPGRPLDRLSIATPVGSEVWVCEGITEAATPTGAHHIEVTVSREVHR